MRELGEGHGDMLNRETGKYKGIKVTCVGLVQVFFSFHTDRKCLESLN